MKFGVSIKVRLLAAFSCITLLFLGTIASIYFQVDGLADIQSEQYHMSENMVQLEQIHGRIEGINGLFAHSLIGRNPVKARQEVRATKEQSLKDIQFLRELGDVLDKKVAASTVAVSYGMLVELLEDKLLAFMDAGASDQDEIIWLKEKMDGQFMVIMGGLDHLLESMQQRMASSNAGFAATHADLLQMALLVSVVSAIVSALLAVVIGMSITRPLDKAVRFTQQISEGDFEQELDVHRKDEVGQLCVALARVPLVLQDMMGRMQETVLRIEAGDLRSVMPTDGMDGAYGQLLVQGNRMTEAYLTYLDAIPMPLMTMTTDMDVLFLNKTGASLGGQDVHAYKGQKCRDIFKATDCGTDRCACTNCMQSGEVVEAEAQARPAGECLDIKYTGSPIRDHEGNIVGAFEMVIDQTQVLGMQRNVSDLAEQASRISTALEGAASTLSAQVEQAHQGAAVQSQRTAETATAMEEMHATVLEVSRSALGAAENSEQTREQAEKGAAVVGEVVAAVRQVQQQAESLKQDMLGLGTQADGIGTIMQVISDIADQTNLLALNAAIEAARAGDAGRGFAVVADEVRKLAEKTMTATTEVNHAISSIQSSCTTSIRATEAAATSIEESTVMADQAGQVLSEIVAFSNEASSRVQGIASAAEQQAATADEIAAATEAIDSISQETSESMGQATAAVVEVKSMAGQLDGLIRRMVS